MATRPVTTGAPTRANVIPFPSRGGTGFRAKGRWGDYDLANVYMPVPRKPAPAPERSPELLIALALYGALGPQQRGKAFRALCGALQASGCGTVERTAFDALLRGL